ncbi:AAA family ATPase [Sorangium sp. So ce1099]|uniref:AAA family ATPase n=1 Tax=Sorangium sp. So ce1099 TaxID=3133331 RepID=UPI003F620B81
MVIDEVAAGLLDARFEVREEEGFSALHGERALAEGARLLLGKATPCVGRDRELGMLRALFTESVDEGTAQATLVVAPPGVGKPRLAQEFLQELRARGEVVSIWIARADGLRAGSPLGMLGQVLRSASLPSVPTSGDTSCPWKSVVRGRRMDRTRAEAFPPPIRRPYPRPSGAGRRAPPEWRRRRERAEAGQEAEALGGPRHALPADPARAAPARSEPTPAR